MKNSVIRFFILCLAISLEDVHSFNLIASSEVAETLGKSLPDVIGDLKSVEMPEMPAIEMPEIPSIEIPSIDVDLSSATSSVIGLDFSSPEVLGAAAVVAILVVGAVASASGGGGEDAAAGSSPKPAVKTSKKAQKGPSLAIPYDAAAKLAYDRWCQEKGTTANDEAYKAFKDVYETKAIADAISKKKARDLEAFENQAPKPVPKRKVSEKKPEKAPGKSDSKTPFFFAD